MGRVAGPEAKNRNVLLDAAEQLLLAEGYGAVTSRRVATAAGLKPQLVHYYFRSMDELFLAVFRRRAEEGLRAQAEAFASPDPLRALWEFSTDPAGTALTMEFMSLAAHRPAIRAEIGRYSELFRVAQTESLAALADEGRVDLGDLTPAVLSFLLTSLGRVLVMERTIGMSTGHADLLTEVEKHLTAGTTPSA